MSAAGSTETAARVAVIGGGPAGLMAATVLAEAGVRVELFDAMPSVGRKFLLAGRGGLNLTHSEPLEDFLPRYGDRAPEVRRWLELFSPADLRHWAAGLGVETFVGSSGRVFPVQFKASPLLRAWLRRLDGLGVAVHPRHRWTGFDEAGTALVRGPDGASRPVPADAVVLALGGASWPRLGSDGGWTGILEARGVAVRPLRPANCGFDVAWEPGFIARHEGEPLKNLALTFEGRTVRGELVLTRTGIEGGAVYALGAPLRDAVERHGSARPTIDLRPQLSLEQVRDRLRRPRGSESWSTWLRKSLNLTGPLPGLLRGAAGAGAGPAELARLVKALPLHLTGVKPIERAISSAGGIDLDGLTGDLMLRRLPGVFAAGEMLDWEAPTGGYLLQASLSSGVAAAHGVLKLLGRNLPHPA
ncbi:TIGR03862 family flavoprotein [Skermanella sp. TT6]|uniref:TIGR03862 family flavoprotein n=1 Tax=Skermanella cutis TaxID=2775420 RepID=A0ABX7B314_9PROT|nr:TIGR03862 family flavoprotein [Skermanella sp. TT6]QQP88716.1 TIGR03862 family flavoprotein [Skermanella sp. TT6]